MSARLLTPFLALLFCWCQPLSAQNPVDSLALSDSLLNAATARDLAGLTQKAISLDSLFQQQARLATNARVQADLALKTAKKDTTAAAETLKALDKTLKEAKNTEKTAINQRKQADRTLTFSGKFGDMTPAQRRQNLPKLREQVNELAALAGWPTETPIADVIGTPAIADPGQAPAVATDTLRSATPAAADSSALAESKRKAKGRPVAAAQRYRRYDPASDVMLHPPSLPCALAQNTRDEFSGETYREVQRGELFRFSNEYVKKTLPPGQHHVVCEAALAAKGSTPSLWLTFTIHDPNARKTFGSLARNGLAVLKFMDGQTVSIYNLRPDEGVSDPAGQVFTFRAQYGLDRDILKRLRRSELDKIRVAWATGYEDYDVQNVNLLRRQADCLE